MCVDLHFAWIFDEVKNYTVVNGIQSKCFKEQLDVLQWKWNNLNEVKSLSAGRRFTRKLNLKILTFAACVCPMRVLRIMIYA